MRERKAQRYQYYHLSQHGENDRRLSLTERDVYVLQRHLHKEHNRAHEEERRVFGHDCAHLGARRKHIRVKLRRGERRRPHDRSKNESNRRHVLYARFEPRGIALAVVVAHKRLHAVPQPVERQRNQLQRAQHNGKRGGVVLVAARRAIEVYVEHNLNGAFGQRHYERRKPERQYAKKPPRIGLHIAELKSEYTALGKEKANNPNERYQLRQHRRKARAVYAHAQREYKHGVEYNVDDRAYQHREHGGERVPLRRYKRVKPLRREHKYRARRIDFKIRRRVLDRARRTAEQLDDLPREKKRSHAEHDAYCGERDERRVEQLVRLGRIVLAQLHARPRRAAQTD